MVELTMDSPAPKESVRLPTFQEREGNVPPFEIKRLASDWQGAVDLVWQVNRPLVDRDYDNLEEIVKEIDSPFFGKDPTSQEVTDKAAERHQKREAMLKTDADEIAQQLTKQEGPLKGKDPQDEEVQTAAQKESKRRKDLIEASDALYAAEDEVKDIKEATEKAVEEAFEKERKAKLDALTAVARAGDLNAPEVTSLSPEEEAELQKKKEEIRKAIIPRYYDEELGIYNRIGADGKPNKDNPVSTPEAYKPVYEELERIEGLTDADGKPTEEAKQAQNLLKTLVYNEEKNAFRVLTTDEIKENERKEDLEYVANQGLIVVGEEIKESMGEWYEQVLTINEAGEITGVDPEKTKEFYEWLKGQPRNETIARLTFYLGAYYETPEDSKHKPRIATLIHHELNRINHPDLQKGLQNPDLFQEEWKSILTEMEEEFGLKLTAESYFLNYLMEDLLLARVCEGKLEVADGKHIIPQKILEFASEARSKPDEPKVLSTTEKQFIIHLANHPGAVDSLLNNIFGIDPKALVNPETRGIYTKTVVAKIVDGLSINAGKEATTEEEIKEQIRGVQKQVTEVYQKVADHSISTEELEKFAEKKGFPRGLGYGLMLLFIFAPSLQGLLGTGLMGEEKSSPGPS